jgi:hypothetical protein
MKRGGFPVRTGLVAGVLASAAFAFSAGPVPGQTGAGPAKTSFEDRAADVDLFARELPRRHKNLFFKLKAPEFKALVDGFKASLPGLNEDEYRVGFSRLAASIGDAHTSLRPPIEHAFPVMLYWFKEGIFLTNTVREYATVLYQKLVSVNGHPIDEVIQAFGGILSHENDAQLRNTVPQVLASAEALHGLRLIPDAGKGVFTFEDERGRRTDVAMTPLSMGAAPVWAVDTRDLSAWPLYMRERQKAYWFASLPESRTVYLKYNSCREMKDRPFAAFLKDAFAAVEATQAERLVVDLRNNGGGDSSLFDPFFRELANAARVNRKGRLFVVLGRQTFSSAVLNAIDLRKRTPAVFVGEPTGGKPNHFGEIKTLRLPRTKLEVSYSTKYFQASFEDTPSLMPDAVIEISIADHRARRDPVLEAILSGRIQ